ncbi:MAG TPA: hypothetical protein VEM32_08815 [Geobacteraceae bacterium]|nr:hypothetical protein [Geobacteraceae bacterium]
MSASKETVPLHEHFLALREADRRFQEERDRRYAEVTTERQKALKLDRKMQDYKDKRNNALRDQLSQERGLYATKADIAALREYFDALHAPVVEFMASELGREGGSERTSQKYRAALSQRLVIYGVIISAIVVLTSLLPYIIKGALCHSGNPPRSSSPR